jgi:cyclopropane fatty-acyl-phospholipid synthase-like methyltransferase
MMDDCKDLFERIYEKPGAAWTKAEPPEELVKLIESGKVRPCKVIDIGCGEGFYSIYLASKGFEVTGVDVSEKAIGYAEENAAKQGLKIRFMVMDVLDLDKLRERFDFVFEWTIMHHITPLQRQKYVENVSRILNKGGKYLSVCFNERNSNFGKPGERVRVIPPGASMPPGTKLYLSSMDEIRELFEPRFRILESRIIEWTIRRTHIGNYFFMEKG